MDSICGSHFLQAATCWAHINPRELLCSTQISILYTKKLEARIINLLNVHTIHCMLEPQFQNQDL